MTRWDQNDAEGCPYSGSLRVEVNDTRGYARQCLPVKPGVASYAAELRHRGSQSGSGTSYCYLYFRSQCPPQGNPAIDADPTPGSAAGLGFAAANNWKRIVLGPVTTPPGAGYVVVGCTANYDADPGPHVLHIDMVGLSRAPAQY